MTPAEYESSSHHHHHHHHLSRSSSLLVSSPPYTYLIYAMIPYLAVPSIALLVYRAWSRKSLTPLGLIAAALTAVAHAVHPWSVPFFLLVVFYIGGTTATKVFHLLICLQV